MNEQEMADRFSAQIDRLLGGESAVDLAVNGDLPLLTLGQQLTEISFQAGPAAQTAFQSQLVSWFGPPGGWPTTIFGLPKLLLLSLGAALAVMSVGLGSVVLISLIWTGALFAPSDDSQPAPAATQPALASPEVTSTPAAATPTPAKPQNTSTLKDVLPTSTTSVGDTIPRPTPTPTPIEPGATATVTPNGRQPGDEVEKGDAADSAAPPGDDDRGHGNDPGGYDPDNPGQSDGVGGGNEQNSGSDGLSPGNLSGGGSGGNSGGAGRPGGNNSGNDPGGGQGNSGNDHSKGK